MNEQSVLLTVAWIVDDTVRATQTIRMHLANALCMFLQLIGTMSCHSRGPFVSDERSTLPGGGQEPLISEPARSTTRVDHLSACTPLLLFRPDTGHRHGLFHPLGNLAFV